MFTTDILELDISSEAPEEMWNFFKDIFLHGRSQYFSKGGSHCVKQRVLAFSQPEYCRLFEYKNGLLRGGHGHPRTPPPLATPLFLTVADKHAPIVARRVRGKSLQWLTAEIKNLMKERENATTKRPSKQIKSFTGVHINDYKMQ